MNYKIFIKNADGTFTDPGTNDMFRLNEPKTYNGNFHTDKNIKESDIVSSIKNNNAADI